MSDIGDESHGSQESHGSHGDGTGEGAGDAGTQGPGANGGGGVPHILVIGGGLVGLTTAWHLERELDDGECVVTLVNPANYMVYQSLLPEVASGMLEPADVVVPLRRTLRRTRIVVGTLASLDSDRRVATVHPIASEPQEMAYDHIVLALGSDTKMLPVPGLTDHAVGFTTVPEALFLRDHVLSRLEAAVHTADAETRRRALSFVFVGGGYSGVEALGELEAMARAACELYPGLDPTDMRWLLVEATDRILPMVDDNLARSAAAELDRRGIDVRLETTLDSAEDGVVELSDGDRFPADTIVWAAGVAPAPLLGELGLPLADNGAVEVDAMLAVQGTPGVWAAGDCASVPDLVRGGTCPPSAQYAVREARHLAGNLSAVVRGEERTAFRYKQIGEMLTLGRHRGVAQIRGRDLSGRVPWYLRRMYHVARVPSAKRKVRVWADWSLRLALGRDVVSLGALRRPQRPLEEAARTQSPGD